MAAAKIHAPSALRIAEARRAGVGPRLSVLGFAAAWLVLAAGLRVTGGTLWGLLAELWRRPLAALEAGDAPRALELALALLRAVGTSLALWLLALVLCVAALLWLAQGPHFALPARARRSFAPAARGVIPPALAALAACTLFGAWLSPALWLEPSGVAQLLSGFVAYLAVALSLVAVIDVASARSAFLRALWMTRQELKDEQREAYGSPELRAARAGVRRSLGREAAQ